jgi:SAM-dependent methyltransferase
MLFATAAIQNDVAEEAFTKIYINGVWDGPGSSGNGSRIENTGEYVAFLQNFMKQNDIHSVVDAGCGDWQFSQYIDWTGIDYKGFDVVKYILDLNKERYPGQNIGFFHADIIDGDLPQADLLVCKDVLQHLSNDQITRFLKQLPKFKYCLITNDIYPQHTITQNEDIICGEYRPLDLTVPPFNIAGVKVLTFQSGPNTKQVLCVKNEKQKQGD